MPKKSKPKQSTFVLASDLLEVVYPGFILVVRTDYGGTMAMRHGDTKGLRNRITELFKEE